MYINYHQLTLCPGDGSRSKDVEQTNTEDTERSWELRSEPPRPKFPVKNGDFIWSSQISCMKKGNTIYINHKYISHAWRIYLYFLGLVKHLKPSQVVMAAWSSRNSGAVGDVLAGFAQGIRKWGCKQMAQWQCLGKLWKLSWEVFMGKWSMGKSSINNLYPLE